MRIKIMFRTSLYFYLLLWFEGAVSKVKAASFFFFL
jgi:hypothetical protein